MAPPYFAVADGMGGAKAGEVASRLAVEVMEEELGSDPEEPPEHTACVTASWSS